jgi:hypothetical protein
LDDDPDRVCFECEHSKAVKEWYRDWHRIDRREDTKRKVFSRITGQEHPAMKPVHFFVCVRCGCNKPKEKYNYEQAEKAIKNREQPTCSACIPELPIFVEKLKVSEMKLYLAEWKCDPVKSGAKKKDVLAVFRQQCKKRLRENFLRPRRNKDTGVKIASKPRCLELCYKQWLAKKVPLLGGKRAKKIPLAIARAQNLAFRKAPPAARSPNPTAKPAPAPVVDLYCLDSESDEEFEFDLPADKDSRSPPTKYPDHDESNSKYLKWCGFKDDISNNPPTDNDSRSPPKKHPDLDDSNSKYLERCGFKDDISFNTVDLDLPSEQLQKSCHHVHGGLPKLFFASVPTEVKVPTSLATSGTDSTAKENATESTKANSSHQHNVKLNGSSGKATTYNFKYKTPVKMPLTASENWKILNSCGDGYRDSDEDSQWDKRMMHERHAAVAHLREPGDS